MGEHKLKNKKRRTKISKAKLTAFVIIVAVGCAVVYQLSSPANNAPLKSFDPARSKGNPEARIRIVGFSDFQCSHCAHGAQILEEYIGKYPQDIHLSMKYFPLSQLNSNKSALYAQCAAQQEKYWPFHDILFETQQRWRTQSNVAQYFDIVARDVGLDRDQLTQCLEDRKTQIVIQKEKALGESFQIRSTPTYFVNGEMVVGTVSLEKKLKELLGLS